MLAERLTIAPAAIARQIGEETVILDLASGSYFGLDPIGAQIWRSIEAGKTPSEIATDISSEYEVDVETAHSDVEALLQELLDRQLILRA